MRPGAAPAAVLLCLSLLVLGAGRPPAGGPAAAPLPDRMADTGGGTQLITAVAPDTGSTSGTLTWWDRRGGRWVAAGTAPARFGANGRAEGTPRRQAPSTTPPGLPRLPSASATRPAPAGTRYPYRPVRQASWWGQDNASRHYNRWSEPRAADCRAAEAEHLITYGEQYAPALVIGFDYREPLRGRSAGSLPHVTGRDATTGGETGPDAAVRRP